jgi:hypothetical protein
VNTDFNVESARGKGMRVTIAFVHKPPLEQTELTLSQEIIRFFNIVGGSPAPLETFEGLPKSFDCQRPFRVWCGRRRTSGVLLVSMLLNSRRMWL